MKELLFRTCCTVLNLLMSSSSLLGDLMSLKCDLVCEFLDMRRGNDVISMVNLVPFGQRDFIAVYEMI